MPDIKFDHIVSCSSEDIHHPAINLLKPETYRKWRCEKAGEEKATVIIQLDKETLIHTIDIGNNGSASVEVLVGKSSSPDANYEVLLQSSSFMSPSESRNMEQMNRVRMFGIDKLCPDIAKKKWDRIMIRCTQPWGNHQYGISFISLHSPPEDEDEPSTSKLGRFVLRDEPQDDIRPGSLFAKWREHKDDATPQAPKTAAAAIAEASSPSSLAAMESTKTKAAKIVPKKREHTNGTSPEAKRHNGSQSPTNKLEGKVPQDNRKALERDTPSPEPSPPSSPLPKKNNVPAKKAAVTPTNKATPPKTATPVPKKATPKAKPKPSKQYQKRPFNKLMSDVTFVLSGFQNPLRANLREQALDMGARYQADWGPRCTHLVCAFANTPKARQVRGQGKIVKKEWIEHCHRERKVFPWRRYALDPTEGDADESEEEIWEQEDEEPEQVDDEPAATSTSGGEYFAADTNDEEIEEVAAPPKSDPVVVTVDDDAYNADTDVESDGALLADIEPLPDVFTRKKFAIHEDLGADTKSQLRRYIVALGGKVKDDLDLSVNYLITETTEGLDALEQCYPDVTAIEPGWIWKCYDEGKLLPEADFKLEAL